VARRDRPALDQAAEELLVVAGLDVDAALDEVRPGDLGHLAREALGRICRLTTAREGQGGQHEDACVPLNGSHVGK
jgi:hypothetical protein